MAEKKEEAFSDMRELSLEDMNMVSGGAVSAGITPCPDCHGNHTLHMTGVLICLDCKKVFKEE